MRRRYFINPSIQLKYVFIVCLPLVIIGISSFLMVQEIGKISEQVNQERLLTELGIIEANLRMLDDIPAKEETVAMLKDELMDLKEHAKDHVLTSLMMWAKVKEVLLFEAFILILGGAALALLFSHRMVGPVYRMRKYMDMLANGQEIPPVRVRGYDEFKEMAASMEKFRVHLNDETETREKSIKELKRKLDLLNRSLKGTQPSSDIMQALDEIKKLAEGLK